MARSHGAVSWGKFNECTAVYRSKGEDLDSAAFDVDMVYLWPESE